LFVVGQRIEGFNAADLDWGTANAKTVTLSFWVRSSLTGTFGGSLQNSSQNRNYPFSYTISAANTWEQKTITITGDTTGTWLTTNGIGIRLNFGFGVGSTYSGTAGSWSATEYFSATGATSVVGTNGATFYITGVQLEQNTSATPFERRLISQELANCYRYFEMVYATYGTWVSGSSLRIWGSFAVPKRTRPSAIMYATTTYAEQYNINATNVAASIGNNYGSTNIYDIVLNGFSTSFTVGYIGKAGNNSDTTTWALPFVGFSAEL
jgi:hypothetical protein